MAKQKMGVPLPSGGAERMVGEGQTLPLRIGGESGGNLGHTVSALRKRYSAKAGPCRNSRNPGFLTEGERKGSWN